MEFHALGMKDLYQINELTFKTNAENNENKGRGGFTGKEEDMFKFKVPQLYNLKDSPFYGHGSSFRSVKAVIEYKNRGIKENENVPDSALSPTFKLKTETLPTSRFLILICILILHLFTKQLLKNRFIPSIIFYHQFKNMLSFARFIIEFMEDFVIFLIKFH